LVSDDANQLTRITSVADGTYSYTTDALGLWRVTVIPGQGWRVTSQQTQEVVLSIDNAEASNIDFCIVEVSQPPGGGDTTLPESGIAVSPPLLVLASIGLLFMATGATLLLIGKIRKN
jgi:hypothetical protein